MTVAQGFGLEARASAGYSKASDKRSRRKRVRGYSERKEIGFIYASVE